MQHKTDTPEHTELEKLKRFFSTHQQKHIPADWINCCGKQMSTSKLSSLAAAFVSLLLWFTVSVRWLS